MPMAADACALMAPSRRLILRVEAAVAVGAGARADKHNPLPLPEHRRPHAHEGQVVGSLRAGHADGLCDDGCECVVDEAHVPQEQVVELRSQGVRG
jgi:hypothetical protein